MVNRFTDPTPFTPLSELSPEAREWHIKVAAAKSRFSQTDDPTELIELGVFPKDYAERRAREQKPVVQYEVADKGASMGLDKVTIDEIRRMADGGKRIVEIADILGLQWKTVRKSVDLNWLGAKIK